MKLSLSKPLASTDSVRYLQNDNGAALIATLGVMSMLIVLGLSFGVTSVYSKKGVKLNHNKIKVKLFSIKVISEGYQFLAKEFADPSVGKNLFPASNTASPISLPLRGPTFASDPEWDGRYYWASNFDNPYGYLVDRTGIDSALHVSFADIDFTPTSSFANSLTAGDTFGWIHIYDSSDDYADVTDTPIVARLAYLIIDESGKIDPTEICSTDTEGQESRIGNEAQEINLENIMGSTLAEKFQSTVVNDGGLRPEGSRWDSYYTIFKRIEHDDASLLTDANVQKIVQNIFPLSYDIEAFHDGTSDKHRFDLSRTDWDDPTMTVDTLLSPASNFSTSQSSDGIPWLNFSSKSESLKKQIAANLIDYNDTDFEATTDFPSVDPPTYVGNELVPYVNEILLYSVIIDSNNRIRLTIYSELVNIYEVPCGAGTMATYTLTVASPDIPSSPSTYTGSTSYINDIPPQSYFGLGVNVYINTTEPDLANNIKDIVITDLKIKLLNSSGDVRDYTYFDTLPGFTLNRYSSNYLVLGYEVDDPRQNLISSDWQMTTNWSTSWVHTWLGLNSVSNPNPGGDKDLESGAINPWDVSTAYIRNNSMQSLWELGAIHRGAVWETINLSKYKNLTMQQAAGTGFGDYNEGDANILSQVKLSSTKTTAGKININTYNQDVLKGIFYDVRIGCTYDNPGSGAGSFILGDQAGELNPGSMITELLSLNGVTASDPFRFRAQIATASSLSDGTVAVNQTTDSRKEEIIGKIANLLTVRQNYFSVIAVSQVIEDMMSNYRGGIRGRYDSGVDKIVAEQKIMAVYYRDALNNDFDLVRYEFLDE